MKVNYTHMILGLIAVLFLGCSQSQNSFNLIQSDVGLGWSQTSVNATIFRKNSIVSGGNYQFVAYYDSSAAVVLARRKHGERQWEVHQTQYKGNVYDAHNVISIMLDGEGYLHMSWDHHNNALNYCKSLEPYSSIMGEKETMIGENENVVSYPEFYRFSNGDLLFAYRNGGSGQGNLVLNRYSMETKSWKRIHSNLIDGEHQRNAYWQMYVDENDRILISWVWRESPDVASNHDMCYAESSDYGLTWTNSSGDEYAIPINAATAEVIYPIPQNSNLINQTSMTCDKRGNAYIATYYKAAGDSCTQFHLIYQKDGAWQHSTITNRSLDFSLSGIGSRSIPISRPQLVIAGSRDRKHAYLIYRDEEYENKVCITSCELSDLIWETQVVSPFSVGRWEPSFDSELWKTEQKLNLFIQNVGQGQAETTVDMEPQLVSVFELGFN